MKTLITLLLTTFWIQKTSAQEQLDLNGMPLGYLHGTLSADEGNYFLLCDGENDSVYIIKYAANHEVIWYKSMDVNGFARMQYKDNKAYVVVEYPDSSSFYIYNESGEILFEQSFEEKYEAVFTNNDRIVLSTRSPRFPSGVVSSIKARILIMNDLGEILGSYEEPDNNTEYTYVDVDHMQNILIGRDVYAMKDDGTGHDSYKFLHTDLVKLTSTGEKLWEYISLPGSGSSLADKIWYIYVDNRNNNYVYLQDYKLNFNQNGILLREDKLIANYMPTEPMFLNIPCKGIQLTFFDLINLTHVTARINEDDPFYFDFIHSFPLKINTTTCSLDGPILDTNGYITYSFNINSAGMYTIQCYDINGNQVFVDTDSIWNEYRQPFIQEFIAQPDGRIIGFFNQSTEMDDQNVYSIYRVEKNVSYPTIDLSPVCNPIESCSKLLLTYDHNNHNLNIELAPDGLYYSTIEYAMFNMLGQLIFKDEGTEHNLINCRSLPNGTYIVQAIIDGTTYCDQTCVIY